MPESCVPVWRCGTYIPIWMNGAHPTGMHYRKAFVYSYIGLAICVYALTAACIYVWMPVSFLRSGYRPILLLSVGNNIIVLHQHYNVSRSRRATVMSSRFNMTRDKENVSFTKCALANCIYLWNYSSLHVLSSALSNKYTCKWLWNGLYKLFWLIASFLVTSG